MASRRLVTAALAASLALGSIAALSACANPIESAVKGAVEQASGGQVSVGNKGSLPKGFPPDVPVIDGDIQGGAGAGGSWTVAIRVAGRPESALATVDGQLKAAGFESKGSVSISGVGGASYHKDAHSVVVSASEDGSGTIVTYVVTPAQ